MPRSPRTRAALLLAALALAHAASPGAARAASAAELQRDAKAALARLYASQPSAKIVGQHAKAILVFPRMVKAGFMFGGQIGEGALLKGGSAVAYYNSVAASYGLQAGAQSFGYALFFMNQKALDQLESTYGFELGAGPSLVVVDAGLATSITSNTLTSDVYAYVFSQKGLMGGIGIQGSKITKISK